MILIKFVKSRAHVVTVHPLPVAIAVLAVAEPGLPVTVIVPEPTVAKLENIAFKSVAPKLQLAMVNVKSNCCRSARLKLVQVANMVL